MREAHPLPDGAPAPAAQAVHWTSWCAVAAVTSAVIGAQWDISWHRSIGRDTFWTPAHIAIYLCGVLGGLAAARLILGTTFGRDQAQRASSVRVLGFRGPLGAFLCAWGGVAMLTSAPFDDWWHNAYGLDVKIISPPHALLALGMFGVQVGALLLLGGYLNRAAPERRRPLELLFLYVGGMMVMMLTTFLMEHTGRSEMHTGDFYAALALALPLVLVGIARASGHRWGATLIAAVYTVLQLGLIWILPLFPAQPKLGPVYHPVDRFVPPEFPLLLVAPAFAIDLVRALGRRRSWPLLVEGLAAGAAFLLVTLAVQWPFAVFLQSEAARNRFFATVYFDYFARPSWPQVRYVFADWESAAERTRHFGLAVVAALGTATLGAAWGNWMRQIRR